MTDADQPAPDAHDPTASAAGAGAPDPAALVARLIEKGEWPDPDLLTQIIAAGEAALGPLLAFIRTYPSAADYSREIVLYNGVGILGEIRSSAAIPELIEILKRYPDESGELVAESLANFGEAGFEAILELLRDPDLAGSYRRNAIDAAKYAAGNDATRRARLAEILRPMLVATMERMRLEQQRRKVEQEAADQRGDDEESAEQGEEGDDGGESDEEGGEAGETAETPVAATTDPVGIQAVYGPEPYPLELSEDVTFLVCDLADLGDPQARGLCRTAFADDLVDTWIADEASIEESFEEGGEESRRPYSWMETYRERYQEHLERRNRPPQPSRSRRESSTVLEVRPEEPPPLPPAEPIRNTGPKLGRNDPCWCGSGKKYKKCHLGKDGRS